MSVDIPKVALTFGAYSPPQGDVIDLRIHLGCTKEVSSFECRLQNWNKKYSPSGTHPITVGDNCHFDIGRGLNCPTVLMGRVEKIRCESTPAENYIRVSGRCWGEKIFRRVVTKKYENIKGEEIVKDLIDHFVGLSHQRGDPPDELIANTDTTYTLLEYDKTPVFDILKYIAETADLAGVIGFDFRVAPDGKFEFFPRNSLSSLVSLSEKIEVSEYSKDIQRIRNKIMVYGAAEKKKPTDGDAWTETLDINNDETNDWTSGTGTGTVSLTDVGEAVGTYCIQLSNVGADPDYYLRLILNLAGAGINVNCNEYPSLVFQLKATSDFHAGLQLELRDSGGNMAQKVLSITCDETWQILKFGVGEKHADEWSTPTGFDWEHVQRIDWIIYFPTTGHGTFWVDGLYFDYKRWEATEEDASSQSQYGLRELVEVDEELHSDNACDLRAKALLDYLGSPAEHITVRSNVVDYGTTPILPADKIHVELPNENIDSDFRIISVEYRVSARDQTLEIGLELGKEPALLADYLYALRSTSMTVERLARTKAGIGGGVA